MKQQQAINKYVELIKKYEKRKKSKKMIATNPHSNQLLSLTHTLESTFFKKSVQQKIKSKVKEIRFLQPQAQASLNPLAIDQETEFKMRKTKTKYEVYQEEMEKRHTLEREEEEELFALIHQRSKHKQPYNFDNMLNLYDAQNLQAMNNQIKAINFRNREVPQKISSISSHGHKEIKSSNKSQNKNSGKKMCELDGSIFHFEKNNDRMRPGCTFYRHMFHNRDQVDEKACVYELLKTMSPITIKPKLMKEGIGENKSFAFKIREPRIEKKRKIEEVPEEDSKDKIRTSITKSKVLTNIHKKERSSLINLRQTNQAISGWEITEDH